MTEQELADGVAHVWVGRLMGLLAQPTGEAQQAAIQELQATLDEWDILRVASVRRAILARLEAAQMGRVLTLAHLEKSIGPKEKPTN